MPFIETLGWLIFYVAFTVFALTARTASPKYRDVLIERSAADWMADASLSYNPPEKIIGGKISPFFRTGWWGPDADRRWGSEARSTITVKPSVDLPYGTRLQGRITAYLGGSQTSQTVTIEVNGTTTGHLEFDSRGTKAFEITLPSAFKAGEQISVTFIVPDPKSPFLLHTGDDFRRLGVGFFEMSFLPPS